MPFEGQQANWSRLIAWLIGPSTSQSPTELVLSSCLNLSRGLYVPDRGHIGNVAPNAAGAYKSYKQPLDLLVKGAERRQPAAIIGPLRRAGGPMKRFGAAGTWFSAHLKREATTRTILGSAIRLGFVLIALAGIALAALVWPPVGPGELAGEWELARGLLGGAGAGGYAIGAANAYPLPFELLFVPIGLLNAQAVAIVSRLGALLLIGAGLWLWRRNQRWGLLAAYALQTRFRWSCSCSCTARGRGCASEGWWRGDWQSWCR